MGLKELNLKVAYDSSDDDVINDFYIPVLSCAKKYYRTTGFFSSASLALAARGIFQFLRNKGKMQIISSVQMKYKDIRAIKDGLTKPEEIIENIILEELERAQEGAEVDRFKLLAWMVANDHLEIRIAVKNLWDIDDVDLLLVLNEGMFHQKTGIFVDENNLMISFSGSINETKGGWKSNIEEFKVFKSWEKGVQEYLESDLNKFFSYWGNTSKNVKTFSFPEAAKKRLINLAPRDLKDLEHLDNHSNTRVKFELWDHQVQAIKIFLNEKNGVLEMATGTGKTFTALRIADILLEEKKIKGLVIVTKLIDLLNQWYRELIDYFGSTSLLIYRHYDEYKQAHDFLDALSTGRSVIHLTSYENLSDLIDMDRKNILSKCLFVFDEIHNLGSAGNVKSLKGKLKNFEWKLGLSATPDREYDEEGNEFVETEVGKTIFNFDLKAAISKGILCEFDYHPLEYRLTEQDKNDIKGAIRKYYASLETENKMSIDQLYQNLAKVRKLSKAKLNPFKEYLSKNPHLLKNSIIFVETRKYGLDVQNIMHPISTDYHTYYSQDDEKNLRLFSQGKLNCLITCRKIAEGIDIKLVNNIIIFSSARSKLETIQRLGRCLRIIPSNPNKRANIVDFINTEDLDENNTGYEPADKYRFKWLSELSETSRV